MVRSRPVHWYLSRVVANCVYDRAAELLNSFPPADDAGSDTDVDSPMSDANPQTPTGRESKDAIEARLEEREAHKLLLAKSYFDCREFDRCAAIFLPGPLPNGAVNPPSSPKSKSKLPSKGKSNANVSTPCGGSINNESFSDWSQKALFLALYAKYIAGEKRMNEDSEMILGPQDGGVTINKELPGISAVLEDWFKKLPSSGRQPQGWLEYLYGIVLMKGKNEKQALEFFVQSIRQYPFNWGAWQELSSLLGTTEEVCVFRV